MCWIRSAVLLLMSRLFWRALETVEEETLAILAISLMEVGLCTGFHRRCTRLQCQIVLQTPFPAHPFSRKLADNWFRFDFFNLAKLSQVRKPRLLPSATLQAPERPTGGYLLRYPRCWSQLAQIRCRFSAISH